MDILDIVLTGVMGFIFALLVRTINRREKKADKRQEQMFEQWEVEKEYGDCAGELIYRTARAAADKGVCNGEVREKIADFETARKKRNAFYRKLNARFAVDDK